MVGSYEGGDMARRNEQVVSAASDARGGFLDPVEWPELGYAMGAPGVNGAPGPALASLASSKGNGRGTVLFNDAGKNETKI